MRKQIIFGTLLAAAPVIALAQMTPPPAEGNSATDVNTAVDNSADPTANSMDTNSVANSAADTNSTGENLANSVDGESPEQPE